MVVRADSAARKRSRPSSGQDTRAPANGTAVNGSGPAAVVNGHGNGDGPAESPAGDVAVVDLEDAEDLGDDVDFDALAVDEAGGT